MRFLADMGVAQRIVDWLRAGGHDAVHLRDEGLQRMPNGEIFEKAASERRVILTFDLDFGEILALAGGRRASVILFRLHNTRTPHVIDRLDKVLRDSMQALEQGAIVIVQEIRRLRQLKLHTDAQAGLAFDHGWPVLEAHLRELKDINARIEELKEQSIKAEMFREAFKYFRMSAELGDVEGMWNLGWRYLLGEGVDPSPVDAVRWWLKAEKLGHLKAREMIEKV